MLKPCDGATKVIIFHGLFLPLLGERTGVPGMAWARHMAGSENTAKVRGVPWKPGRPERLPVKRPEWGLNRLNNARPVWMARLIRTGARQKREHKEQP